MTNPELPDGEHDFTDQTLMRRLKDGEMDAATALYIRYAKRLQRLTTYQTSNELSHRISSEEIVQSVFRTFFRRAAKGQYDVAEGDDLWKLFLVIALNKIRKAAEFHQAKKRDVKRSRLYENDFFDKRTNFEGEQDVALSILKMTVEDFLAELPAGHSEIVRLRIEGHSILEIAETTGRAKRTIERVIQNFRQGLIQMVED